MITKLEASELFGVKEKCIKRFDVEDVFNAPNTLAGWISIRPDNTYGSLIIDTVNGIETKPQYIRAMPKLHYPFHSQDDGTRVYTWPLDWVDLEVHEKWDGTNICSYYYKDSNENIYQTFKTRLTPIAGNSELFGNFAELVKLVIGRSDLVNDTPVPLYSVCYELCGYRNPHLVKYDFDVALKPLCTINQLNGDITPIGKAEFWVMNSQFFEKDLTTMYNASREKDNTTIIDSNTEQGEFPVEGKVFYVYALSQGWVPVKCKPQIVEDIHFARGGVATYKVREACLKALEAYPIEEIDVAKVEDILLEDWHPEAVKCSFDRIVKELQELKNEAIRRRTIKEILINLNWEFETYPKQIIMSTLSEYFNKSEMRRVYNSARAMGLIGEE